MKITCLELNNFRNYNSQTIYFKDGINVLIGDNAQGKTNMIESIFLCAIGKSPRTSKEKELIKWNSTFSKITLEIKKIEGAKKIEFYLFQNQSKAIKINGFAIKKMSELLGEFNAVYFSPDELKLVKDSPLERRKFMDISISQFNKNYFFCLSKYNEILQQRNKLLKSTPNQNVIKDTIAIWDEEMAKYASKIIIERLAFIEKLKPFLYEKHNFLTDNQEKLDISYTGIVGEDEISIKNTLLKQLGASLEKDMALGFTSVGPHKDDLKIVSNGIDIRNYGSQGQQRTCALSFKLAELEVLKSIIGEYPVLLLDDVLSELDINRQQKLLESIKNIQTIITCTNFDFDISKTVYQIKNGEVIFIES